MKTTVKSSEVVINYDAALKLAIELQNIQNKDGVGKVREWLFNYAPYDDTQKNVEYMEECCKLYGELNLRCASIALNFELIDWEEAKMYGLD